MPLPMVWFLRKHSGLLGPVNYEIKLYILSARNAQGPCGGGVEEGLWLNKCTLGWGPITNGSHSLMGYCAIKKVFDGLLLLLSHFSHVQLFSAVWTLAYQVPLSVGFSRQKHWSGFPCPPPGVPPDSRIKPTSLTFPALTGGSLPLALPGKPLWRAAEYSFVSLSFPCPTVLLDHFPSSSFLLHLTSPWSLINCVALRLFHSYDF